MLRPLKQFGIKQINIALACLLSGILLALPFNNGKLWVFAWFGFVPLFFALNNKSLKEAFILFFITGIIFWSATIYWLAHVTLAGMIILILYLSLYFGLFGLIIRPCTRHSTPYALVFIPAVWVLLEYIRGYLLTGFPWALLGYSQYLNLPAAQIADITGAWGVSFLLIFVNVAIVEIICSVISGPRSRPRTIIILLIPLLVLTLGYGYYRLNQRADAGRQTALKISVIQGNIPQEIKWDIKARDAIIDKYFKFSSLAAKQGPGLIIWPEASLPIVPQEEPGYFKRVKYFVKKIDTALLLGSVTSKADLYYNSAILFSRTGTLSAQYDKIHLVPFGEYTPLKRVFWFLQNILPIGEFAAGNEYKIFTAGDSRIKFSVLICFEDVFPGLSRRFVNRGAGLLINITNDAWFKKTAAPYQHLQASVFRAIENRVPLVRSANTGVSSFIASSGRIISQVSDNYGRNIFIDGYDTQVIGVPEGKRSFYNTYGDIFILLCFITVIYGIIIEAVRLKKQARS